MNQPRRRPFEVGLHLPVAEGTMNHRSPRWNDLLKMARRAEEIGFDSLWVPDHVLFRPPDAARSTGTWECWTLLAALAASTTRIKLAPHVTCISLRNPALLAKMADTVDEISGGRLILGLGAGWNEPEYRAFGYPFDHLYSRFEEAIHIIHSLLRRGEVDFVGRFHEARECELRPRGPRPNGPPIMIGATRKKMLHLTARYADLWNPPWTKSADELLTLQTRVDAACQEVGRDPLTLGRTACVMVDLPSAAGRGGQGPQSRGVPPKPQSIPETIEVLRGYAHQGVSHVQVWIDPSTIEGLESFAPVLEALDGDG